MGKDIFRMAVWLLAALPAMAQAWTTPMRPADLIDEPDKYLNRAVEVLIVEPIDGPETPSALASIEYGQIRVQIPEGSTADLALVPAGYRSDDANRYRRKFDRLIKSPLRVRGEFLRDDEMTKLARRPVYVIRVAQIEAVAPEPARRVGSLAEIEIDPTRWDRKRIEYEGDYRSGFEVSALDGKIWLAAYHGAEIVGKPGAGSRSMELRRVRVTGTLFAKRGAHYGHLGGYTYEIVATRIEYLPPAGARGTKP